MITALLSVSAFAVDDSIRLACYKYGMASAYWTHGIKTARYYSLIKIQLTPDQMHDLCSTDLYIYDFTQGNLITNKYTAGMNFGQIKFMYKRGKDDMVIMLKIL